MQHDHSRNAGAFRRGEAPQTASSRPAPSAGTSTISASPPNSPAAARLGKIHTVHASILRARPDLAPLPAEPEPAPAVIDWDRWLGPAPLRPYNQNYVEGRWRGHYAFHGGAGLPEWGAHTLDLCQWAPNADGTTPVEFENQGRHLIEGRYASGVKLVMRLAGFKGEGELGLPGTCPCVSRARTVG